MARTIRIFVVGCVLMAAGGGALMPAGAETRPRAARVVTFDLDPLTEKQSRYWTDARIASLPEADAPEPTTLNVGTADTSSSESAPVVSGDAVSPSVRAPVRMPRVTALRSTDGLIATEIPDPSQFPFSTHGKIVALDGTGGGWVCSGTIVDSASGSLVLTAAHCVVDDDGTRPQTIRFIPGYRNGARASGPYGVWTASQSSFLSGYLTGSTPNYEYDLAALRFPELNGLTLQETVGARGYLFNAPGNPGDQLFNAFGYPAENPFDGELLYTCRSQSGVRGNVAGGPDMVSMACDMTGGSSGGGWIVDTDPQNGKINSVVSIGVASLPGVIFGPYFGSSAQTLWSTVGGGGTTPDPDPDPTEPVTHPVKLTLKLSGRLVAAGKMTAPDGYLPCTRNAPVRLYRKVPSGLKPLKQDVTGEDGKYRIKVRNRPGRYVVLSPEGSVDEMNLCDSVQSPIRRNE